MIEQVFENLIINSEFDFVGFFKKDVNEEVENKLRKSIEKLSKSEFLKKRKLFIDVGKIINLKTDIDLREKQIKFDKLLSNLIISSQPKVVTHIHKNIKPDANVSANSESNIPSDLKEALSRSAQKINESFVHQNLTALTQNMITARSMIDNNPNINLEPDLVKELIAKTNEFISSIQGYFFNFKNYGSFTDDESETNQDHFGSNVFSSENLEKVIAKLMNLEKHEMDKFLEIRNINERLKSLSAHIKTLNH